MYIPADQQLQPMMSGTYAEGNGVNVANAENHTTQRLTQSTPGSPGSPQEHGRPNSFEVIGSAESLVGRVNFHFIFEFNFFSNQFLIFFSILSRKHK